MGRCAGLTCHDAHGAKEVRREAAVLEGVLPVDYKCELATGFLRLRVPLMPHCVWHQGGLACRLQVSAAPEGSQTDRGFCVSHYPRPGPCCTRPAPGDHWFLSASFT